MHALLLKYRRVCLLAICALLGLSCGNLVATLLGVRLDRDNRPRAAGRTTVHTDQAGDSAADLAYILQHHLFDPASRTATAPAISLRQSSDEDGGATVRTAFELIGTVVAGQRSIAVLRTGQETKSYRTGDQLPGGGRLEEVVRHRATVRNADHSLTTLTMHEGDRTVAAGMPQMREAGTAGQVRTAGDNRWIIPRSVAEGVRDNLGEQLRLAQMQPRIVNGRTEGFEIKKLSPGTLLAQMGLRRGDVIVRVNTMPIDSPEKALQILQQLREARQLNVDLERDGKSLSFAYAIE